MIRINCKPYIRYLAGCIFCLSLLICSGCDSVSNVFGQQPLDRSSENSDKSASASYIETESETTPDNTTSVESGADSAQLSDTEFNWTISIPDESILSDSDRYPYYARLSDKEKKLYVKTLNQIIKGKTVVNSTSLLSEENVTTVISAIYNEQPQLFWIDGSSVVWTDALTGLVTSFTIGENELADDLEQHLSEFEEAAGAALSSFEGMTEVEKEKALHDYCVMHIDYGSNEFDQTAYGGLVTGECVCAGFARTFQFLMQCEDIPIYYCIGEACNDDGWDDHAWNIVKFGDGYYNIDVTWDNCSDCGIIYYDAYNETDEHIQSDHHRYEESEFLPACSATEYSFEALFDMPAIVAEQAQKVQLTDTSVLKSLDEYYTAIQNHLIENGIGTNEYCYIVYGATLSDQISQNYSSGTMEQQCFEAAEEKLNASIDYTNTAMYITNLDDGYYRIELTVSLEEKSSGTDLPWFGRIFNWN